MHKFLLLFVFLMLLACNNNKPNAAINLTTKFENTNGTETPTYFETIEYYKKLATAYPEISLIEMGETDSGYPLHLVIFNSDKNFDLKTFKNSNKNIILINNAIHPGESDGVNSCSYTYLQYWWCFEPKQHYTRKSKRT